MTIKEMMLQNFLIWACVYPTALGVSYGLNWFGLNLPLWFEILVSTAFTVPFISLAAIPMIEYIMQSWRLNAESGEG